LRYLILSDLHSNGEALAAVLARAGRRPYDCLVVLGDLVGYGADPNEVVRRVRRVRRRKALVRGNHDRVAAGLDSGSLFNSVALAALRWTSRTLTPANRLFLAELPVGPREVDGAFVICHGSPLDEDAYIFSDSDAAWNFRGLRLDLCFFGHSHIPSIFTLEPDGIRVDVVRGERQVLQLEPGRRYLVNPGSVGQPRDRNISAAYAVYDSARREIQFERVPYDVISARAKIVRAGLPEALGDRLLVGA
jgi:diadenosine tetraphosphatase ApaH/serine/threonine PP2A family protein phosphatase